MGFFEHDRYNKKRHNEDDFYYSNDGYIIFLPKNITLIEDTAAKAIVSIALMVMI